MNLDTNGYIGMQYCILFNKHRIDFLVVISEKCQEFNVWHLVNFESNT